MSGVWENRHGGVQVPDWIATTFEAIIKIGFWRGLTLALIGATLLLLFRSEIVASADVSASWRLISWFLLVSGAAGMITSALKIVSEWAVGKASEMIDIRRERQENLSYEKSAQQNLAFLDQYNRLLLLGPLTRGEKRFPADPKRYYETLLDHHIIVRPSTTNAVNALEIRDSVWALREHILKNRDAFLAGRYPDRA